MKGSEKNNKKEGQEAEGKLSRLMNRDPKKTMLVMFFLLLVAVGVHVYTGYFTDNEQQPTVGDIKIDDQIEEFKKGMPKKTPSIMEAAHVLQLMKEYEEIKSDSIVDTLRLRKLESKIKSLNPYEKN